MSWALWLALPVTATALAALVTGLVAAHRRWAARPLSTRRAMQAQRDYLDALGRPPAHSARPPRPETSDGDPQVSGYKLPP